MDKEELKSKAIEVLLGGGIVIFPTDTAFGIGCRIDNFSSVEKLFRIRRRPENQAAPVLVGTIVMAKDYLQPIGLEVEGLMKKYWPGALTIVYPCLEEKVPHLVRGGGITLGVRVPNEPMILEIINQIGVPILGPSANFHGESTPYRDSDLNPELVKLVDLVIPGEAPVGMASTVVDCSIRPWKVLREGVVKL